MLRSNTVVRPHKVLLYKTFLYRLYSKQLPAPPKEFIEELTEKLHLHSLNDWYSISKVQLKLVDKSDVLLRQYKSIEAIARAAHPSHPWDHNEFVAKTRKYTPQALMVRVLRTLFDSYQIKTNVRDLGVIGDSGKALEVDAYLPEMKLAFEYQDLHHYFHSNYGTYSLTEYLYRYPRTEIIEHQRYQKRDEVKQKQLEQKGITLIQVPFWWDWSLESIIATIKKYRPELLHDVPTNVAPLPIDPPPNVSAVLALGQDNTNPAAVDGKRKQTHQRIGKSTEGDWNDHTTHRLFFDKFARERGFDPLVADNWYKLSRKDLLLQGKGLLAFYGDSYTRALMQTYPSIGFELHKFSRSPRNFWSKKENQRKFFDEFARSKKFDPLIAEHWYSITKEEVLNVKSGVSVLNYYKGSLASALVNVYPFVDFDTSKLPKLEIYWSIPENKRNFLDKLAAARKFDPNMEHNWKNVSELEVVSKGGYGLLKQYGGNLSEALRDIYAF